MPMRQIAIAFEEPDRAVAEVVAQLIDSSANNVVLLGRSRFPTADPMLLFFISLNDRYDAALILIGSGPNARSWILPELAHQVGAVPLLRVAPVLLGNVQLPKNWPQQAVFFSFNSMSPDFLKEFLSS